MPACRGSAGIDPGSAAVALTPALLLVLVAALLAAWSLAALARRFRTALPSGTVVYSDADGRGRPLHSPVRGLTGKPDYVIRTRRGALVPIELKSYRCGAQPPHGDVVQIGAYLLLLEDLYGRPSPFGVLRYTDRCLRVPYSGDLRAEVLRLLADVVASGARQPAGAPSPGLCRRCPFAPICPDRAG